MVFPGVRLSRRTTLATPALLLGGFAGAEKVRLRPDDGRAASVEIEPASGDVFRLWVEGVGDPVELPALRARRLANLPVAGRDMLALVFGVDCPEESDQDLLALVGWDGMRLRILGLETLLWRRGGAAFRMRPLATPDRRHVALECIARLDRPMTRPFHVVWADLLQWSDGGPLGDALPRPPLAGSWQAEMGGTRRRVAAFLAEPRCVLTPDDVAGSGILQQFGCMADR